MSIRVHLQVEKTDKSTKICAKCCNDLIELVRKREICAAANSKMKNTVSNGMNDGIAVEISAGQQVADVCISLIDDENDAENEMTAVQFSSTNSLVLGS